MAWATYRRRPTDDYRIMTGRARPAVPVAGLNGDVEDLRKILVDDLTLGVTAGPSVHGRHYGEAHPTRSTIGGRPEWMATRARFRPPWCRSLASPPP